MSKIIFPKDFNYNKIKNLSNEVLQKLNKYRPYTLEEAFNIEGMTPSAISILKIYMKKIGVK